VFPAVSALMDGGDFIAEISEEAAGQTDARNQHGFCPAVDWVDMLVRANFCPANRVEESGYKHVVNLACVEELQTEDCVDDQSRFAQVPAEDTEPLPTLTIHPLGLNVAPIKLDNLVDENVHADPIVGKAEEVDNETSNVKMETAPSELEEHSTETAKPDPDETVIEPVKEQTPYIVKATPKEVVIGIVKPLDEETKIEVEKEIEPESKVDEVSKPVTDEKYSHSESAVDEELLEQPDPVDVIAPFSQWAEKKLVEEALLKDATKKETEPEAETNGDPSHPVSNLNPVKTNGIKLTKNFASTDCSAKVMGANPESQGSGNVITFSKDEYFLNKCTDQAWFVVELCESIKALKIQIANFELYSSSPNHFRVSIGNVFPGREKDWMEFGTFSYQDERNIQTFKSEVGVVGKYARVEILSHHGSEHYCPVSMFKVFGISEIDLITEDDPDDGHEDAPDEPADDSLPEHIIVKTIKEAVHKVVNVFRPQNVSLVATLNTSSLQGASLRFRLRPDGGQKPDQEVVNRYHMIYYLLATQYHTVRQYTRIMGFHRLLPLLCNQFNIEIVSSNRTDMYSRREAKNSSGQAGNTTVCTTGHSLPWQFAKFVRVVHGEDFLVALCNVVSMEVGQSRLVDGGRVGDTVNTTTVTKSGANGTVLDEQVGTMTEKHSYDAKTKTVVDKQPDRIKDIQTSVSKEKDISISGSQDQAFPSEPPPVSKSEPSTNPIPPAQAEPAVTKPVGGASSVKPVSTASVLNTANQAGQTTWQKLSNRIKALERNVTLSSGFLEELSLKYIKQIEELNNAVKVANDAISGVSKREELARERGEQLATQVHQLSNNMEKLVVRVSELQEEVLARHGLLLLLEVLVIGLVFLLCRPGGGRMVGSKVTSMVDRRRSLDTIRGEREKSSTKLDKRRSSIEVGCLPNGQLGTMLTDATRSGLSKKQRKKKRRRDSRLGLRNVLEELESDDSKGGTSVYETFHGSQQSRVVDKRLRSRSWSEQHPEDISYQKVSNTSGTSLESPSSRFAVDQVWEADRQVNTGYVEDLGAPNCVFEANGAGLMYQDSEPVYRSRWCQDNGSTNQDMYRRYQDRGCMSRVCLDDIVNDNHHTNRRTHPGQGCLTHSRAPDQTSPPVDTCKAVWFPGRSRKGSVIRVPSQGVNGHPAPAGPRVELSNRYTMLEHSVHETSACETEPEVDEAGSGRQKGGHSGGRQPCHSASKAGKNNSQLASRSKSSSPNRQANLLMRRQRDAIRKFQPDQAEWLHKKRDS